MKIGRNAPCPCGSGKKYKACCLKLERSASTGAGPAPGSVRRTLEQAEVWRVDLQPLAVALERDPDGRPVAILVEAGGLVADAHLVDRPSAEPDEVAKLLVDRLAGVAETLGGTAPRLEVRYPVLVDALERELEDRGLDMTVSLETLEELDAPWRSLMIEMTGRQDLHGHAMTTTWAGWGRGKDWVEEVFRDAAQFFRAAPWRHFDDTPPLMATTVEGDGWIVSVLGSGAMERGVAIFSHPSDFSAMMNTPDALLPRPVGRTLALTFLEGHEVPGPMRREVVRAGWEVASAEAYPALVTRGTLGGGVGAADSEVLQAVLRALASWAQAIDGGEPGADEDGWVEPVTGLRLMDLGRGVAASNAELIETQLLAPGFAEGPGADPGRMHDLDDIEDLASSWMGRFETYLEESGLASSTRTNHSEGGALFVDYVLGRGRALEGVHEADLWLFLFDWYPRKVLVGETGASGIPAALKRLFDFLAEQGVQCPWARPLLAKKQTFLANWRAVAKGHDGEERVDLNAELARRVFLVPEEFPGLLAWQDLMGWVEHSTFERLTIAWRRWRDEEIRAGISDSDTLIDRLYERASRWLQTPNELSGDATPVEAVLGERQEREERARARDGD